MALFSYPQLLENRSIVLLNEEAGERPSRFLIKFPDGGGIAAGRLEAAEHFANAFAELESRFGGRTFRFIPFSHTIMQDDDGPSESAVDAYLAI